MSASRREKRGHLWDTLRNIEDRQDGSLARAVIARHHAVGNLLAAIDRDPLKESPGRARKNHSTIKADLLAEHGAACSACPAKMPADSLIHLHHVIPVSESGPDTRENCVLLCPNCHAVAHWRYRNTPKYERPTTPAELLAMLRRAA